jgi:hypothetical protein
MIIHNEKTDFTFIVIYCIWFMHSDHYGKENVKWALSLDMDEEILPYNVYIYIYIYITGLSYHLVWKQYTLLSFSTLAHAYRL